MGSGGQDIRVAGGTPKKEKEPPAGEFNGGQLKKPEEETDVIIENNEISIDDENTVDSVSVKKRKFIINIKNMMSQLPIDLGKVKKEDVVKELLRVGIIAELDAVNLYEQLASYTEREDVKKVFLDIAREEKTHVGEFQTMLLREDAEQGEELLHGADEIGELLEEEGEEEEE